MTTLVTMHLFRRKGLYGPIRAGIATGIAKQEQRPHRQKMSEKCQRLASCLVPGKNYKFPSPARKPQTEKIAPKSRKILQKHHYCNLLEKLHFSHNFFSGINFLKITSHIFFVHPFFSFLFLVHPTLRQAIFFPKIPLSGTSNVLFPVEKRQHFSPLFGDVRPGGFPGPLRGLDFSDISRTFFDIWSQFSLSGLSNDLSVTKLFSVCRSFGLCAIAFCFCHCVWRDFVNLIKTI